jgi:hypothetical protein
MKTFTKWNIRTGIFFGIMILILLVTGQVKVGFLDLVGIFLIGTISLGAFMYLIEDKYFPFRRKQVLKKVLRIFNAEHVSDSQAKFKVGNYDLTVEIDFILSLNKYTANGEVISFHVPRVQLKQEQLNRPLSQIEAELNGKPTFRIYQTNGIGLKLAKKRIEKRLK